MSGFSPPLARSWFTSSKTRCWSGFDPPGWLGVAVGVDVAVGVLVGLVVGFVVGSNVTVGVGDAVSVMIGVGLTVGFGLPVVGDDVGVAVGVTVGVGFGSVGLPGLPPMRSINQSQILVMRSQRNDQPGMEVFAVVLRPTVGCGAPTTLPAVARVAVEADAAADATVWMLVVCAVGAAWAGVELKPRAAVAQTAVAIMPGRRIIVTRFSSWTPI